MMNTNTFRDFYDLMKATEEPITIEQQNFGTVRLREVCQGLQDKGVYTINQLDKDDSRDFFLVIRNKTKMELLILHFKS